LNLPKYFCRKFNIPGVAQRARRSFQTQQLQGVVMQSRPPARSNTSPEARRLKRVRQQAEDGYRGKATKTAMHEDCEFEDPADALADLRKLHPEEPESPELHQPSSTTWTLTSLRKPSSKCAMARPLAAPDGRRSY
jgi:hypothetical protein